MKKGLTSLQLTEARNSLEGFRSDALSTLQEYYRKVVNDDIPEVIGKGIQKISKFRSFRHVEIAVVASDISLRPVFDNIEREGLSKSLQHCQSLPGARCVSDFRAWINNGFAPRAPGSSGVIGKPKMLDVYHLDVLPDFEGLRAIVLPRLFAATRTLWYGALAEDPYSLEIPPSSIASRVLAKQIGRSY